MAAERFVAQMKAGMVKVALPLDEAVGGVESVWASPDSGGFALDNIPLLAYGVSNGDVIDAVERDGQLTFVGVRRRGGHSTYRVAFPEAATKERRRDDLEPLRRLGCGFEWGPSRMVAIDVPPRVDIYKVYEVLERGMDQSRWTFEEGHCGHTLRDSGTA